MPGRRKKSLLKTEKNLTKNEKYRLTGGKKPDSVMSPLREAEK
jgi:hypothetical protein